MKIFIDYSLSPSQEKLPRARAFGIDRWKKALDLIQRFFIFSWFLVKRLLFRRPGADETGKVKLLAESDETGASEIELDATVEGQELEIAFNVKFLQDGLEAISTVNVVIETNTHITPAAIRSTGEEDYLYVLMPMHMDGR